MPRGIPKRESWVTLRVEEIKRETDKAFCVKIAEMSEDVWLPKSQLKEPDRYGEGDNDCEIEVTEWICQQKNLPTDYTSN